MGIRAGVKKQKELQAQALAAVRERERELYGEDSEEEVLDSEQQPLDTAESDSTREEAGASSSASSASSGTEDDANAGAKQNQGDDFNPPSQSLTLSKEEASAVWRKLLKSLRRSTHQLLSGEAPLVELESSSGNGLNLLQKGVTVRFL